MDRSYQVASVKDRARIAEYLSKEGQVLLPLVDLVEVVGRATIEAVLVLSAQGVAGPEHRGKATGKIRWHGRQAGRVCMSDRKLRVDRPRLRRKGKGCGGEVEIPAYEAMVSNPGLGKRMLEVTYRNGRQGQGRSFWRFDGERLESFPAARWEQSWAPRCRR